MPSIVVFGATGFIGAALVKAIKQAHPSWPITAYARTGRSIEQVKSELGVENVVLGDFSETDKIRSVSKEHDIAINAAWSFTAQPVQAIAEGLKARSESGLSKGKLIHTTGGGNFIDGSTSGEFNPKSKVWNDDDEEDVKQIVVNMANGASDTVVLDAGKDGAVETYIVCPGITYGLASTKSKSLGIGYGLVTANAKQLGYVPYIGDGSAVVAMAHVLDVVDFLLLITERAASGPAEGSVYSRYYMLANEAVTWKAFATETAKVMHAKGLVQSPEAKSVDFAHAGESEVKYFIGSNMLMKGDRAAKMGFKITRPSVLEAVHADLKDAQI